MKPKLNNEKILHNDSDESKRDRVIFDAYYNLNVAGEIDAAARLLVDHIMRK